MNVLKCFYKSSYFLYKGMKSSYQSLKFNTFPCLFVPMCICCTNVCVFLPKSVLFTKVRVLTKNPFFCTKVLEICLLNPPYSVPCRFSQIISFESHQPIIYSIILNMPHDWWLKWWMRSGFILVGRLSFFSF